MRFSRKKQKFIGKIERNEMIKGKIEGKIQ